MEINRKKKLKTEKKKWSAERKPKNPKRNQACHPKSRHVTEEPSKTKCLCMLTTKKKQESQHNNLANP
jgi:hypothetical protein